MKVRMTLVMVGTLAFAATPFASYADSNQALDACVKSFISSHVPKDREVRVRKHLPSPGPLAIMQDKSSYAIMLSARVKGSGKEIAQARCVANARGEVIAMDSPPADTEADLAAVVTR